MAVIKVKPWSKDQGDFVLLEEEDFDKEKHELYSEPKEKPVKAKESPKE